MRRFQVTIAYLIIATSSLQYGIAFTTISKNRFSGENLIINSPFGINENKVNLKPILELPISITRLEATKSNSNKKRRRKTPPTSGSSPPIDDVSNSNDSTGTNVEFDDEVLNDVDDLGNIELDKNKVNEGATFELRKESKFDNTVSMITRGIQDAPIQSTISDNDNESLAIPLPDITQARKRKQMEEELLRMEEEKEKQKVRIKRTDKEAFRKLLEQQPFADADPTLFEEEAYGTVSALLGERAKPFLSIPFGPLQVGHFIGSLGIILMAFIEYPGFPLTNLPTPLRECLQGGLLSVYTINIALAVASVFKSIERGQPIPLWVVKTVSVGGLAYDQLTQLPTLEDIEKAKSVKGKRSLKNKQR